MVVILQTNQLRQMRGVRTMQRFCRAKTYISKFDSLETEVNNLQLQLLQKNEELTRIKNMTQLSRPQFWQKELLKLFNQPYEYPSLQHQKDHLHSVLDQIQTAQQEAERRVDAANKLKDQQKEKMEVLFLTDLARFSQKYQHFLKKNQLEAELQTGIELSHKSLDSVLNKERVEWVGQEGTAFDPSLHSRVEGDSPIVKEVVEKGFKVRGNIIERAQIK